MTRCSKSTAAQVSPRNSEAIPVKTAVTKNGRQRSLGPIEDEAHLLLRGDIHTDGELALLAFFDVDRNRHCRVLRDQAAPHRLADD
jgi:hypothetical protein